MARTNSDYNNSPLSKLYVNGKYDIGHNRYPINLESEKRGHYINFFINVADETKVTGDIAGKYQYDENGFKGRTAENYVSGTNNGTNVGLIKSVPVNVSLLDVSFDTPEISLQRKTKRIKHVVSLYMPDTVNVQYSANWQDTSLTDALGDAGLLLQNGGQALKDVFSGDMGTVSSILSTLTGPAGTEAAGNVLGKLLGNSQIQDFALFAGGVAVNPQLEVLFKGVGLRQFQFDFLFAPANRLEAKEVENIIKTFKFHAAPEIFPDAGLGRYMIPPSEFDIEFMYQGNPNEKIHKIGTCVLTNINIDYAPNGWSTFGGSQLTGGGSPVQTRLTLQFQETEIVTKERVNEGY